MYITNGDKNMPIYSWHCQTCNELYDELLGMGKHSEACPECGESNQEKLLKQLTSKGKWFLPVYLTCMRIYTTQIN